MDVSPLHFYVSQLMTDALALAALVPHTERELVGSCPACRANASKYPSAVPQRDNRLSKKMTHLLAGSLTVRNVRPSPGEDKFSIQIVKERFWTDAPQAIWKAAILNTLSKEPVNSVSPLKATVVAVIGESMRGILKSCMRRKDAGALV